MTDNEATIFLFLAVVVAAILAATGCDTPDLVEPPEAGPAECEAWMGCGVVG